MRRSTRKRSVPVAMSHHSEDRDSAADIFDIEYTGTIVMSPQRASFEEGVQENLDESDGELYYIEEGEILEPKMEEPDGEEENEIGDLSELHSNTEEESDNGEGSEKHSNTESPSMQTHAKHKDGKQQLTLKNFKGCRRYLVYDDLVANIVNFSDGTPIVEFQVSNKLDTAKLPVECGICPEVMPKSKLSEHLRLNHYNTKNDSYQCTYCPQTYRDYKYLAGHSRRHMGIRPYVCSICKLYFSTKQDMRVHSQRRHSSKEFTCHECGKQFSQNTQLKRHRESTHEKKRRYQCDKCPKAYYKNFSLKEHVRNVHLGQRRMLKCPFCGMECRDAHKMARHRRAEHLNQRVFKCEVCSEEFNDINYFDAHKRSIQCRGNTKKKEMELQESQQVSANAEEDSVLIMEGELADEDGYQQYNGDEEETEYYIEDMNENNEYIVGTIGLTDIQIVEGSNSDAFIEEIDDSQIAEDGEVLYEIVAS